MNKKSILWCMAFLTFLFFSRIDSMPEMPMTVQPAPIPVPLDVAITPTQIPTMPTSFAPELPPPPPPMPVQPMPMEQIPPPQMEIPEQMPMMEGMVAGAQTISLQDEKVGTQGNWVKKREWLKCSLEVNDEIQNLVSQIKQSKSSFVNKITSADNQLDDFYRQIAFKQGELQSIFEGLLNYLDKKRKQRIAQVKASGEQEGVTSEMEVKIDIVEDEIKNLKNQLDQFKLDMKSIEDLDHCLENHLKKLDEQIEVAQSDASAAKQLVDDIWNMIDDKKARLAYYELKGNILEKIKTIKNYVQTSLLYNLDSVIATIRNQINQVRNDIANLESNGFIIKNRAKRLEQLKLQELDALKAGQAVEKTTIKKEKTSGQGTIYNFFVGIAASVYKLYRSVVDFFISPEKEQIKKVTVQNEQQPLSQQEKPNVEQSLPEAMPVAP